MWNLPNFEKLGRFFTHGGHIMDKLVHQVRLAQWSQRIIERKNSGLTISLSGAIKTVLRKIHIITGKNGSAPPPLMQQVLQSKLLPMPIRCLCSLVHHLLLQNCPKLLA